jgi:hypothetical protein
MVRVVEKLPVNIHFCKNHLETVSPLAVPYAGGEMPQAHRFAPFAAEKKPFPGYLFTFSRDFESEQPPFPEINRRYV